MEHAGGGALARVGASVLLFVLVAGMAASIELWRFRHKFAQKTGIGMGLLFQFVLLPAVGLFAVTAFDLPSPAGITLLLVTSSPGGSYSNWWCSLFNADLALSVAMTTVSTVLSLVFLPFNALVYIQARYGTSVRLDWRAMLTSVLVVVSALCTGLGLAAALHHTPVWKSRLNMLGNAAGIALIVLSFFVSSQGTPVWDKPPEFYFAVATPCVVGLAGSLAGASLPCLRLSRPERVAIAIETCYQNIGLAISIAMGLFEGEERSLAVGVPLFYGVCQTFLIGTFCVVAWLLDWTYAPATAPLVEVLTNNYQLGVRGDQGAVEMGQVHLDTVQLVCEAEGSSDGAI